MDEQTSRDELDNNSSYGDDASRRLSEESERQRLHSF